MQAARAAALCSDRIDAQDTTALVTIHQMHSYSHMDIHYDPSLCMQAIVQEGHADHLQLVLFHPEAVHSAYTEGPPDAADYTIRAPHPTV